MTQNDKEIVEILVPPLKEIWDKWFNRAREVVIETGKEVSEDIFSSKIGALTIIVVAASFFVIGIIVAIAMTF